jgi:hypothetical protein
MLAVDGQQRGAALLHRVHEQFAADHQRLLVGQQQALAGARAARQGARPAAPTMAAMTASTDRATLSFRAHRGAHSTCVQAALLELFASSAACGALAITANCGLNCAHCCQHQSTWSPR